MFIHSDHIESMLTAPTGMPSTLLEKYLPDNLSPSVEPAFHFDPWHRSRPNESEPIRHKAQPRTHNSLETEQTPRTRY